MRAWKFYLTLIYILVFCSDSLAVEKSEPLYDITISYLSGNSKARAAGPTMDHFTVSNDSREIELRSRNLNGWKCRLQSERAKFDLFNSKTATVYKGSVSCRSGNTVYGVDILCPKSGDIAKEFGIAQNSAEVGSLSMLGKASLFLQERDRLNSKLELLARPAQKVLFECHAPKPAKQDRHSSKTKK